MTQSSAAESKSSLIKKHFSLFTDIATVIAAIVALFAYFLKIDVIFSTAIYILVILFLCLGIYLRSRGRRDPEKLYSYIKNDLLPNDSKRALGLKTDVVIVEATETQSVHIRFRKEFKNIDGIKFTHFVPDSSNINRQRSRLLDTLSGAESVVLIRTKELERTPWVYETVQEWALENSHAPCLVIDQLDPYELELLKTHPIPENFFFISDDAKSLPWSLLKRANQRTSAWRTLAKLNRATSRRLWALLFIAILAIAANHYFQSRQRRENLNAIKEIYKSVAKQTKKQYENQFPSKEVTFSHWMRSDLFMYQLSSSGDRPVEDYWRKGLFEDWAAGCVLRYRNHIVKAKKDVGVFELTNMEGDPVTFEHGCKFAPQGSRPVRSILCVSSNQTDDDDNTVGICIDTPNESDIFDANSVEFMKERIKEFHTAFAALQKRGDMVRN